MIGRVLKGEGRCVQMNAQPTRRHGRIDPAMTARGSAKSAMRTSSVPVPTLLDWHRLLGGRVKPGHDGREQGGAI